jgi:hypothetical protein
MIHCGSTATSAAYNFTLFLDFLIKYNYRIVSPVYKARYTAGFTGKESVL